VASNFWGQSGAFSQGVNWGEDGMRAEALWAVYSNWHFTVLLSLLSLLLLSKKTKIN
jgi:hypothetical protein